MGSGPSLIRCACQKVRPDPVFGPPPPIARIRINDALRYVNRGIVQRMKMYFPRLCSLVLAWLVLFISVPAAAEESLRATTVFNENKAKALQGEILGQYRLGICFARGHGVVKDPVQAEQWKKKADAQIDSLKKKAADGDAPSQFTLGFCHAEGMGVAKDKNLAYAWYRKAADQGDVLGQFYVAWCYADGAGVQSDLLQSLSWFRKAAEQGHLDAQKSLGASYKYGEEGVAKDEAQAFLWYHEAAIQGDGQSCLYIAMCYLNGTGKAVDKAEAYAYCLLAAQDKVFAHDFKPLAEVMSVMESSATTTEQRVRGIKRSFQLREEFDVKIAAKKAETSKKVGK